MLFGDVCEFIRNGASIKQGKGMSGIPITRIETLAGGRINPNRVGYANIYDPHLYDKHILCEGDLLISHINSERYIGRVVMYRGELEGPIIHGMNLLRARLSCLASVLPDYVELYFKTTRARKYILSVIKKAVNQVSVSATDFKCMPLPVPSMELQRQIVDRLSAAKARAEKLEGKAREGVAVCETMRKAILKEAFE
jgi:type I restriction enzyme S subunit